MTTKTNKAQSLKKVIEEVKTKADNLKQHNKEAAEHLSEGFSYGTSFDQPEFNAEIYEMHPPEAAAILKYRNSIIEGDSHIKTNRRIDPRIVERIKNEILNNDWYEESANVAFNKEGTLIDGQHTLAGIVAANKPTKVLVKTGCRNRSVQKIDISRSRTLGQRLKFSGELPIEESDVTSKFRADMAGLILRSEIDLTGKKIKKNHVIDRAWYSDKKVIDTHNLHKSGIDYFVKNRTNQTGLKKNGIYAPLVKAFNKHPKKVKEFYVRFLNKKVAGESNNAPRVLRNLVDTINQLKASKEIDGDVYKQLMNGRSEIKFWFNQTSRALDCFINDKTYNPNIKK